MLPFEEKWISENESVRIFTPNIIDEELKWHTDLEDRIIESSNINDWKFQFDNELPINIDYKIHIKQGVWHRLIKGSTDLELNIKRI